MNNGVDQIGFEQLGIGSVLRQNRLSVPANQREYSWTEEEVTTLLQDFARAINDDEPGYFLGTIVTIPHPDGTLEVVDGQQRLATTAILLATIRDYLKEREDIIAESIENDFLTVVDRDRRERVPRLRLNVDDNEYFRARLTGGEAFAAGGRQSHERIEDAFLKCAAQVTKIVAAFDKKDHGDALNRWIQFVEKRALVVLLKVPNDANAYRMFETLNDRGLRTSQSDLIKNYLFGRSGDRLPEVQHRWALMRGTLESLGEEDITITFLRHALIAIRGFVREAKVYETVQSSAISGSAAVTFVTALERLSADYVATHNSEHANWNGYPHATRRAIEVLNLFNIKPMRPLVLAVAAKFSQQETDAAFKFFISAGVRLLIASSTRTESVERPLAKAAHTVFAGEIKTAIELTAILAEKTIPSNELFRSGFLTATVSTAKIARYYLRSLELAAKEETEPWLIPNDDRQAINLEHVLPRNPEENWPEFDEDDVRLFHRRIGNLALLQATTNADLKSASFEDKKAVYAESPYVLTRQIADAEEWTKEKIQHRQEALANYAIKAWPL